MGAIIYQLLFYVFREALFLLSSRTFYTHYVNPKDLFPAGCMFCFPFWDSLFYRKLLTGSSQIY